MDNGIAALAPYHERGRRPTGARPAECWRQPILAAGQRCARLVLVLFFGPCFELANLMGLGVERRSANEQLNLSGLILSSAR